MGKVKNRHPSQNPKNISAVTNKMKQKEKKKKQQKNSNDDRDFDSFQLEMDQLKKQVLTEHNEAVKIARKSYESLTDSIDKSDIILQVLDARDPHACRILEIEKLIKEKGKQLINVINKIDLIPQEVAIRWLGDPSFQIDDLSQLLDFIEKNDQSILSNFPSKVNIIAISSKDDSEQKKAWNLLHEIISSISTSSEQLPKISIIGISKVGKSAIQSILNANNDKNFDEVSEVPSYSFVSSTDASSLLNAVEYCGYMNDFCLEFINRAQDESIFDVLAIEPTESDEDVLKQYAKVIHKNVTDAADELAKNLLSGSQRFFSVPDDTPLEEVSEFQQAILDSLSSSENDEDSIHINRGDPLTIDDNLIQQKEK